MGSDYGRWWYVPPGSLGSAVLGSAASLRTASHPSRKLAPPDSASCHFTRFEKRWHHRLHRSVPVPYSSLTPPMLCDCYLIAT